MTTTTRILLLISLSIGLSGALAAQQVVLPDKPPTFDRGAMAARLYYYAAGPDVRLGRDIEVHYLVTAEGRLHSPFIAHGELQIAGRSTLFHNLNHYSIEPATFRGSTIQTLWKTTLRFERSGDPDSLVHHISVDGERFSFPPLTTKVERTDVASTVPNPVEGTTTPPAASAPSLSMDLNMVSLSYTEIFDGTITATLLVERDGSHALPVRVESNVAPSFTAEVIDVLSETAITPGKVKGRPVRSLLEVTIVCSGVKTAGGRTEQGIRIAQRAPVPVPEADQIAKDTVTVPGRTSEMVEQETIIYDQIEAPAPITERTIVDKPVPPTSSEEMIDPVEERVVTREVGASYDPDELSRLMAFPEGTAERGREEYVVLSVHVTPDGQTGVIEVLAGSWEPLEAPAIEAVSRLRFQPATVDGNPVESTLVITLRYTP